MRILLTSTASYVPPRGGSTRSNLAWLEHLASRGHACRVVCAAAEASQTKETELREQGLAIEVRGESEYAGYRGIEILGASTASGRSSLLRSQIEEFRPDWVLVSSEDLSHTLLKQAASLAAGRVVYLAHTPQFFPFGHLSWNPDRAGAAAVRNAAGAVVISATVREYMAQAVGIEAAVIHPPIYGAPPFRNLASFRQGFVTMVNPSAVKGLPIFLELASALPGLSFAALPSWGTTEKDRASLRALPNVTLLKPVPDIEELLERSTILLTPSLWFEGFGLIAMEAMARGLPVVSSDAGGLREAKQGTGFVLPVRPIEEYLPEFDDRHMPVPIVPHQSLEPWISAVRTLTSDEAEYATESRRSYDTGARFVASLDAGVLERYLSSLARREMAASEEPATARLARLSPEKRAMLLSRLRRPS